MADPTRVVICGSLAHPELIKTAVEAERAAGREVMAWPGGGFDWSPEMAADIWRQHIEAADEVVIVRKPDGSKIGEATYDEWGYALSKGKLVRWFPYWDKLAEPASPGPAADTGMSVDEAVPPADGSKERLQYELRLAWARVDVQRGELDRLEAMEQRARGIAERPWVRGAFAQGYISAARNILSLEGSA